MMMKKYYVFKFKMIILIIRFRCNEYTTIIIYTIQYTVIRVNNNLSIRGNHDTIGMITLDGQGKMAAGTTTNGKNHKIPGKH